MGPNLGVRRKDWLERISRRQSFPRLAPFAFTWLTSHDREPRVFYGLLCAVLIVTLESPTLGLDEHPWPRLVLVGSE